MITLIYRTVGGFMHMNGTFLCRLRFSLFIGLCLGYAAAVHHLPFYQSVLVFGMTTFAAFLGRIIPHSFFQDGGQWTDFFGMALVGFVRLALILAPLSWFYASALAVLPFGFLQGLAYFIGTKFLNEKDSGFYYADPTHNNGELQIFAKGGSGWGEVLTGALVYEFSFLVLLFL